MDKAFLLNEGEEVNPPERTTWGAVVEEVKKLCYLAGPMVGVNLSAFLLQVISLTMVGHLGELELSGVAMAFSICGVTGFSVILGMASALETLSGQAYGAQQYQKLGTQTFTAIFCLIISCIPLSILWIFLGRILAFIGQDPLISQEAGKFTVWLVPNLYGYATLQPLIRYFLTQSIILPMLICSVASLCFHILFSWIMVYKIGLGTVGAAIAMDVSMWLNVSILILYMRYSPSCAKTRAPISKNIFHGIKQFFILAIPSTVMTCLQWWAVELLILLSGLLPNPQLETSTLCVCLNTTITLFAVPYGLAAAVSTRVSNELGAGNPRAARFSVFVIMILALTDMIVVDIALLACRRVFGYIFSSEKEVVDYVTELVPLLCISVIMDSLQGTLSGVARGCGWQHIGAYINLASFYLFGIPIAGILGFYLRLRGKGLWIGILCGATMQSTLLAIVTGRTDWKKQAMKARERFLVETSSHQDIA